MDLDSKYELGAVAANDRESKTFRARETASGREVFVHILFGGKPLGGGESLLNVLSSRMTDPDPAKSAQVLEIGDYKGMPFAVTPVVPGFQGLRAWLDPGRGPLAGPATPTPPGEDQSRARTFKVPTVPVAPSAPATPEDEFDRLFGTAPALAAAPQPAPGVAAPPPPPPPAGARQEGEFTQLFRSTLGDIPAPPRPPQAPRAPDAAAPSNTPPAPPPPVAAAAPVPPPAKASPAAPPPPLESGPGEFTRMFHSEAFADSSAMPAAMPEGPPALAPEAGPTAGEFTRMFQASPAGGGASPVLPSQPEPGPAQPGGFTGVFGTPPSGSRPPASPAANYAMPSTPPANAQPAGSYAMPPQAPPSNPQPMSGKSAGEFTQLFGRQGVAGSGVPASPPPPVQQQGATGVFSTPAAGPSPLAGKPLGPGEYTRVFGAQSSYAATGVAAPQAAAPQAPAVAAPQGTAPASAAKPQMPLWPVVIGATIVLLAAFGLLVYFLSRK